MMNVDEDLFYDAWRTRGPEYTEKDAEDDARERWEDGIEMLDVLGAETASYLLWEAYAGNDIKPALKRYMDEAWEDQKKHWEDLSYGL